MARKARSRDAIGNPRPRLAPVSGLIQPRRAIWGRFTIDVLQCPPYLLRKELHARVRIVERQVRIYALKRAFCCWLNGARAAFAATTICNRSTSPANS